VLDALTFAPVFRPALIFGLAFALAVVACIRTRRAWSALGLWRSVATLGLRLLFIAGLALALMRPMLPRPVAEPAAWPVFSIVVDRSASMTTPDVGDRTRAEAAAAALIEARDALERQLLRRCIVKVFEFSDRLRPTTFDRLADGRPADEPPEAMVSDIAGALMNSGESGVTQQAGVLLVSDGRVNHVSGAGGVVQAARYLRSRKVPVWTVTLGEAGMARDLFVTARLDQNFLFVRQPGVIEVTINQSGYKDWPATVRLQCEGEEVAAQQTLLAGGVNQINFPIVQNAPGLYQYVVEVDPLPGEADRANNRRAVFVRVTDRRTQVLIVEAEPYWDSKFMQRALMQDPNLDVTSIFQINDRKNVSIRQTHNRREGRDPDPRPDAVRIPRTRDELFAYDVVIVGRGAERLFSAADLRLFKEYLTERGGNLIFARGKAYENAGGELASLEPLVWADDALKNIRISPTGPGRASTVFDFNDTSDPDLTISELPTMISVARVREEKSMAVVLARTATGEAGDPIAAIAWHRYGKGKVLSIGAAGLWRWSLVPDENERHFQVYQEFWSRMIRWLAAYSDFLPDQEITFDLNRNDFRTGEQVRLTARTRLIDTAVYAPAVEIVRRAAPGAEPGKPIRIVLPPDPDQPGVFACTFVPDEEGEYEAVLHNNIGRPDRDAVRFTVYEDALERRFVAADPALMEQVARITGGDPLAPDQLREMPDRLSRFEEQSVDRPQPIDAWDRPLIFYLLAGVAGLEWLIRRLSGLV
jgi:hypothetical protein